jgi:hypothetical protein
MYGLGMQGCEVENDLPEKTTFRKLVMEPITQLIEKGNQSKSKSMFKVLYILVNNTWPDLY